MRAGTGSISSPSEQVLPQGRPSINIWRCWKKKNDIVEPWRGWHGRSKERRPSQHRMWWKVDCSERYWGRGEDGSRGSPRADMQEVAQRAMLGAHSRCKVMEEEVIWAGLGIPGFFPGARNPLGNGRNYGETGRETPRDIILYQDEELHLYL